MTKQGKIDWFSLFFSDVREPSSGQKWRTEGAEDNAGELPVMNDTAEGLIRFLSAHETLGDERRLMGRRELTRCRLFGWCMCLDEQRAGVHRFQHAALSRPPLPFSYFKSPLCTHFHISIFHAGPQYSSFHG